MQNYFSLFGIEKSYHIDQSQLRKKFYSLTRESHPDLQQDGNVIADEINIINLAYATLSDPLKRLKYIIDHEGYSEYIEKPLDSEFLMNMMDLHEEIDSAVLSNNTDLSTQLSQKIDQLEDNFKTQYETYLLQYDSGNYESLTLQSIVDFFVRLRYLRRLRKALKQEEEI